MTHTINAGLDHALALVQRLDAHVIPLDPNTKQPLTYAGRQLGVTHATQDTETICAWFGEHPDALVGIAAGASGLIVIDIDQHGDKNGYTAIAEHHLTFPTTPRAASKSGKGEHVLMLDPSGTRHDNIAPDGTRLTSWQNYNGYTGIDRIAGNGYVCYVGPAVDRAELAPAPTEWMRTKPTTQRDSDGYTAGTRAWLEQNKPGDPDSVTMALVGNLAETPQIGYEQMRDTVAALVSIGAEGRPVARAIEAARAIYTRPPYNTTEWGEKFDLALDTAIRAFGAPKTPMTGLLAGTSTSTSTATVTAAPTPVTTITEPEPAIDAPDQWNDGGLRSHQRIAARFEQTATNKLLYVDGTGWHQWDGTRWAPDHGEEHTNQHLTALLQHCWAEAIADKDLAKDAQASMTASGSRGVLALAQTRLFARHVDNDPYLLNVANGTLDLHTLELRAHDPADNITKITRSAWHPEHRGTGEWGRFLKSTIPDRQVRHFLQRWAGVALIGRVVEHALVIANGSGRNGKGVLSDSISHTLGDYAVTAPPTMLTVSKYSGKSASELASLMHLRGARWAVMSELPKGAQLNEALMKSLTGGDMIHAKHMGQNPIDFHPSHSFFMQTNDLPLIDPDAAAVWARMLVVPFNEDFTGREDKGLRERLELESDAVLAWCVEGLREYWRVGLDAPAAVTRRTDEYRKSNDHVAEFVADECEVGPNLSMVRSVFANEFTAWAKRQGLPAMKRADVYKRVTSMPGITRHKIGVEMLRGVSMRHAEDVEIGRSWTD